jgi:hypothetical protein
MLLLPEIWTYPTVMLICDHDEALYGNCNVAYSNVELPHVTRWKTIQEQSDLSVLDAERYSWTANWRPGVIPVYRFSTTVKEWIEPLKL